MGGAGEEGGRVAREEKNEDHAVIGSENQGPHGAYTSVHQLCNIHVTHISLTVTSFRSICYRFFPPVCLLVVFFFKACFYCSLVILLTVKINNTACIWCVMNKESNFYSTRCKIMPYIPLSV